MRRSYDQHCPVARTLDLLGERWTLLLIRDLFAGRLRFTDLRHRFPDLAPNLLSARLCLLVDAGVIRRTVDPAGYELAERGQALRPAVTELARWGLDLLDDPDVVPFPPHLLSGAVMSMARPEMLDRRAWSARIDLGDLTLRLKVRAARRGRRQIDRARVRPARANDVTTLRVHTTPGALIARRADAVSVAGPAWAAQRFDALFALSRS